MKNYIFSGILTAALLFILPTGLFATEPVVFSGLKPGIYVPPPKKKNEQTKFIIKLFTPTGIVDKNRTVYLGAEIPLTKQWGLQPEVGYIYNAILSGTSFNKDKISFSTHLGLRYYWPQSTLIGFYTGPEILYRKTNFNVGQIICDEWIPDATSPIGYRCDETTPNTYDITRNEYGLLLKIGIQPILFKRIAIDFSFAAGIKYVKNNISGKIPELLYPGQEVLEKIPAFEKNEFLPSFPGSVKIGFAF